MMDTMLHYYLNLTVDDIKQLDDHEYYEKVRCLMYLRKQEAVGNKGSN